jgi:hypothetical protein
MNSLATPNFNQTPLATPHGFNLSSNANNPIDIDNIDEVKEITKGQNLTTFYRKYANEDDVSFSKIMGEERLEHQKKYWWKNLNQQNQLQLEDSNQVAAIGWAEPGENVLIFVPKGIKQQEMINPPLMTSSNTRFVEDPFSHVKDAADESQSKEMELLKLLTKESNQAKYNARLGGQMPISLPHSQKSDKVDLDDLMGGEKKNSTGTSINGFDLIQHHEIMHFNMQNNNSGRPPLLLDSSLGLGRHGGDKSNFKVPETPDRQQLGISLAQDVQKSINKRNQQSKSHSLVNTPRSDNAKRMAAQLSQRSIMNSDSQLRSAYSPSPRTSRSSSNGKLIATPSSENILKRRPSIPTPGSSFNHDESQKQKKLKTNNNNNNNNNYSKKNNLPVSNSSLTDDLM